MTCILGASISLTGCVEGVGFVMSRLDNPKNAFDEVRERNIDFIETLHEQGFLTDTQKDDWVESVTKKVDKLWLEANDGDIDNDDDEAKQRRTLFANPFIQAVTPESAKQLDAWINEKSGLVMNSSYKLVPINETDLNDLNGKIGQCGENGHTGGDPQTGSFYTKTASCSHEEEVNGEKKECGAACWEEIKLSNFDWIAGQVSGMDDFKGKAYPLYDSNQVSYVMDALQRPIYIITKFEGNNTPEKLQAILAILNKDQQAAQTVISQYSLENEAIGSYHLGELAATPTLTKDHIKDLETVLISYCEPALDENGAKVPYLKVGGYKPGNENGKPYRYEEVRGDNGEVYKVPYIFADTESQDVIMGDDTSLHTSKLGQDLLLSADGKIALAGRLMEFNPELIETLKDQQRIADDNTVRGKFYVLQNSENYVIKLDYPLYKISEIRLDGENSSKNWRVGIEDSTLFMNLGDGAIYDQEHNKIKYSDKFYTNESCIFWNFNYINSADPNSDKITVTDPMTKIKMKVHPLVLLDYVETYRIQDTSGKSLAKGSTDDQPEYWIPMGRRMRVSKLKGGEADIDKFAQSLESDGSYPSSPHYISLKSVSDKTSGYDFYEGINERLGLGDDNEEEVKTALAGGRDGKLVDALSMNVDTSNEFGFGKDVMFTYINPTVCIGQVQDESDDGRLKSPAVGQIDHDRVYTSYQSPTVYGMCLSTKLTDSGMVGGSWIGGSVEESVGLKNWNNWLKLNSFAYQVDIEEILELLGVVIDLQEQGENAIVFDPNVIGAVSEEFNTVNQSNLERFIRTSSRIFGVLLMSYALLLVGAWVFDTNVFGGPQLLTKLTFGHWIAVQDKDEVGDYAGEEKHYMDLRDIMVEMVLITAVGVFLFMFDFFDMKEMLMRYIQPLIDTVKSLVTGG